MFTVPLYICFYLQQYHHQLRTPLDIITFQKSKNICSRLKRNDHSSTGQSVQELFQFGSRSGSERPEEFWAAPLEWSIDGNVARNVTYLAGR